MCLDTAWSVMSNGSASSPTVAGPLLSRATIARRTGSARAEKPLSSESLFNLLNHFVDQRIR